MILEKYKSKFNLSNMKLIDNLTMNILIFANSSQFGKVVLKIGSPGKTAISEINYIKQYPSNYFVKCYYYNIEDRVMLLERITPGYDLMDLKNQKERIKIFCNILNNIIVENTPNSQFNTYEDILKNDIKLVNGDKQKYNIILHMLDNVNKFYNEIKEMNLSKYILHNDLQHKNIIKSNRSWKVIDPHGVIGEKIFETTQFIRSEIDLTDLEKMDEIVTLISDYIKEDKLLIYKALYINMFSKNVFYIRTNYDENIVLYNINICKKILDYIF